METEAIQAEITDTQPELTLSLPDFIASFGPGLLQAVQAQNAPVYNKDPHPDRTLVMEQLLRTPFVEQQHVVQACARLLGAWTRHGLQQAGAERGDEVRHLSCNGRSIPLTKRARLAAALSTCAPSMNSVH